MINPYRIIFVCLGNTCRSPMAEYIMRHLLKTAGLADKVRVSSAGCKAEGKPMSRDARKELERNKIPFDNHRSKLFTAQSYQQANCVIALDNGVIGKVSRKIGGDTEKKIRLFTDLDGRAFNVDDPFPDGDYRKTFKEIFIGCSALLKQSAFKENDYVK